MGSRTDKDVLMNTYEWECDGCETHNVMFVIPEDGKQIELTCKKCGAPWHKEEEVNYDRIIRSLEISEALASTCSTSMTGGHNAIRNSCLPTRQ